MKKPNRIARKGDTAPNGAQAKRPTASLTKSRRGLPAAKSPAANKPPAALPPRSPSDEYQHSGDYGNEIACFDDQRLFRKGSRYVLVTDYSHMEVERLPDGPGQTVQELTRDQARDWLDRTVIDEMVPDEFRADFRHRAGTKHADLEAFTLGEVLSPDNINELAALGAKGHNPAVQVAGAVESWLSFSRHMEQFTDGDERLHEAATVLVPQHHECNVARARSAFINESTARFFRQLLEQGRRLPWNEAIEFMSGLAKLIEYHPGLADEYENLEELAEANYLAGNSGALSHVLKV